MGTANSAPVAAEQMQWLPKALRLWSWSALGMGIMMLFHSSDFPVFLGRYSALVTGLLAGLFLSFILAQTAARVLDGHPQMSDRINGHLQGLRTLPLFGLLVVAVACAAVIALCVFFLGDHVATYAALRAFLALSIVMLALGLLVGGATTTDKDLRSWWVVVIPGLLVVGVLALAANSVIPPLWKTDEAFVLSMGINLRDFGNSAPLIYQSIYPDHYAWGGLWLRGLTAWIQIFGDGLSQGRLYILAAGALAVMLTSAAAARLYDRATAGYTALIMSFMILRLGYLRPDMVAIVYLAGGLAAYAWAQTHQKWFAHVLTGLLVGLSIDAAPIMYLLGVGFGILYLGRGVRAWQKRRFGGFIPLLWLAVGGMLAIGLYVLTRAGSTWATPSSPASDYLAALWQRLQSLAFMPQTDLNALFTGASPLVILALIGIIALLARRAGDRGVVVVLAIWLLFVPFLSHYFPPFYVTHGVPLLSILAGVGIRRGLPEWLSSGAARSTAVSILLTVWLGTWVVAGALRGEALSDVVEAGREIAQVLPDGAIVVGAEPFYFGMLDDFRHSFRGGAFEQSNQAIRGIAPEDTWAALAPDYLIFAERWPQEPARTPALMDYMQQHAFQRIGCWTTSAFGLIEVWGSATSINPGQPGRCP